MEDRITEQDSAYDDLQRMSVHDILTGINREEAARLAPYLQFGSDSGPADE